MPDRHRAALDKVSLPGKDFLGAPVASRAKDSRADNSAAGSSDSAVRA